MIRFDYKSLTELDAETLYAILQLRSEIFVVEQKCVYLDPDGYDQNAIHITAYDQNDLIGYARVLPPGVKYPQASIGRVAVRHNYRGKGLARQLFQYALDLAKTRFPDQPILAQSQCYLETFYASFGFIAAGAPYDDDGIMHIDMILKNN